MYKNGPSNPNLWLLIVSLDSLILYLLDNSVPSHLKSSCTLISNNNIALYSRLYDQDKRAYNANQKQKKKNFE